VLQLAATAQSVLVPPSHVLVTQGAALALAGTNARTMTAASAARAMRTRFGIAKPSSEMAVGTDIRSPPPDGFAAPV
jgi:hypothetical protein